VASRLYNDEHEIITRYLGLSELLSGAKAQDLVAMRGAVCRHCYEQAHKADQAVARAENAIRRAEGELRKALARGQHRGPASPEELQELGVKLKAAEHRLEAAQKLRIHPGTRVEERSKDHKLAGRQKHQSLCSRCRKPWEGIEIPVFKGEIESGRRIGATSEWYASMLDEYGKIRPIMENRPRDWEQRRWRFARFATLASHHGGIGSLVALAEEGARVAPEYGAWWSYEVVKYWVRRFECKIRERGERSRLLSHRGVRG